MHGKIHSFQSLGTVDGPGVRCVVFMQGCPLRCVYCHNPDTWNTEEYTESLTAKELLKKIMRYKSYIKDGGVTVSGGEPLLQAKFVTELFTLCKQNGIHTALDTSGCIINSDVHALLNATDLCLLDIKMTNETDYKKHTGGSLTATLDFLSILQKKNIPTIIRQVIVQGINNDEENIKSLNNIVKEYSCIQKTELLPFRKLCTEKYNTLGIDFPLAETPETPVAVVEELQKKIN
ncbi:pyruvate formate-lyase-activating enzyme [Clostridia bacterium]|nr:pyruvate formate-lyase-activating enzyme [Clostridia bacterium]